MNKKLYLGASLLMIAAGLNAAPITPQQALQRASSQKIHKVKGIQNFSKDLLYTYESSNGDAAVYVFGTNGSEGYLLLSADDAMAPVLGYADNGVFDARNMPPQMKEWLAGYARQQEYARENGIAPYKAPAADGRKAVEPLMKTKWNQTAPFNEYTPKVNGVSTPTGCVATAMAQVMKYWSYPEYAVGMGSIINPATGSVETMILDDEDLLWDDMLDSYNGESKGYQKDAVAYLMKACGYSVDMSYNPGVSGSFSVYAAKALIDNFRYNSEIRYYQRDYIEASRWDEIMYNEVSNGRPVLYGAQSTSGGHEFVCDGYSGDGYYHFNWGWGGMSDGYFILDSLNPGAVGTGGGAGGGFNYKQDIVVGIQPQKELIYEPTLTQFGQLSGSVNDLELTFRLKSDGLSGWCNTGLENVNISIGAEFKAVDNDSEPVYVTAKTRKINSPEYTRIGNSLSISYSGEFSSIKVNVPSNLADGKYKVTLSTNNDNSGTWVPVMVESNAYNYIYLTKTGSSIEVENLPAADVTLDSFEFISPVYFGSIATISITVTNHSEKQMTNGFYPELYLNNRLSLVGDGIVLTLQPNETVTQEFTTQFRVSGQSSAPSVPTPYELKWKNPDNNTYYDIDEDDSMVTVNVSLVEPRISVQSLVIENARLVNEEVPGRGTFPVYQIEDIEDITAVVSLKCDRGFFGYPVYFSIFKTTDLATQMVVSSIMQSLFDPLTPLEAGDSCEMTAVSNMSGGELGTIYAGMLFYNNNKDMVQVDADPVCFKLVGGAGVDSIEGADDVAPVYYNLQGQEVKNPNKGDLLIKKQGSKTTKIIY